LFHSQNLIISNYIFSSIFLELFMSNIKRKTTSLKSGFTLIELLVVIAIIGVLATIAAVGAHQAKLSAQDARRMEDINSLQRAVELAFLETVDYRTALGSCASVPGSRVASCDGTLVNFLDQIDRVSDVTTNLGCAVMDHGCDFSIVAPLPTATSYRIGFWLEGGIAGMAEGAHYLTENGVL
jgi:prepilin-type N-terminal cleavage/methylation domain-containing protein